MTLSARFRLEAFATVETCGRKEVSQPSRVINLLDAAKMRNPVLRADLLHIAHERGKDADIIEAVSAVPILEP